MPNLPFFSADLMHILVMIALLGSLFPNQGWSTKWFVITGGGVCFLYQSKRFSCEEKGSYIYHKYALLSFKNNFPIFKSFLIIPP